MKRGYSGTHMREAPVPVPGDEPAAARRSGAVASCSWRTACGDETMRASFCLETVMRSPVLLHGLAESPNVTWRPRRRRLSNQRGGRSTSSRSAPAERAPDGRPGAARSTEMAPAKSGRYASTPIGSPRIAPGYACNGRALADDVVNTFQGADPCDRSRFVRDRFLSAAESSSGWRPPWRGSRFGVSSVGTGWGKLHDLDKVTEFSPSWAFLLRVQRRPGGRRRVSAVRCACRLFSRLA